MKAMLEKGSKIAGEYTITFLIQEGYFVNSYRAKNESGQAIRVELLELASLSSAYFDDNGKLLNVDILRKLDHKNIIKMIDCGETTIEKQRHAYFVYEYAGNESIVQRVQRDSVLSPFSAIPILIELIDAIKYLQRFQDPLIHNNISPETVFLDYSDHKEMPILTGFENARLLSQTENKVPFKNLTLFYAAPEVMNGIYIPQSDIYSLGGVFYYMLVGVPPYYDEGVIGQPIDKQKKILEQLRNRPLDFSLADPDLIDDHLQNTMRMALAFNFRDRFGNMDEFVKALNREVMLDKSLNSSVDLGFRPSKSINKGEGFSQIAGMDDLKRELREDVIDLLNDPELYKKYGIPLLNGLLLYGPPGCGKTFIAQKFAEEVGHNFITIKPSDLQSKFVNATQENIGKLFKEAEQKAPTIIFIDELDAIASSRDGEMHHMNAAAVNELLAQMTNCGERGIFVIGATNRPEKIDPAILRTGRLDKHFYIPPPDSPARASMFRIYLKDRPTDLSMDYDKLSTLTENYVASDIKFIVDQAAKNALRQRARISMEIIGQVIHQFLPSVTLTEIIKYEGFRKNWEIERSGIKPEKEEKKFGFN